MRPWVLALAMGLIAAPMAQAEVVEASPTSFRVVHQADVALAPEAAWSRLVAIGTWWSDAHTYSGAAANLRVNPQAGGCFCEAWGGANMVEHGRVILALPPETLRFDAPLGPLQELPVRGVMTFAIAPQAGGARVTLTYVVAGPANAGLAELAPLVDMVLGEQMARFAAIS
ncbi:MAG: ATPase [Hydrogenophilaceae bacterium]|jgi:uncharacterized protein YndB with AHSA1/START domain|nr:ATPase [Hydrogenophilaceae bacterium]